MVVVRSRGRWASGSWADAERERTDEEIAAEDTGGDDVLLIEPEDWPRVPERIAELLDVAERDGPDGAGLRAERMRPGLCTVRPRTDPRRRASSSPGRSPSHEGPTASTPVAPSPPRFGWACQAAMNATSQPGVVADSEGRGTHCRCTAARRPGGSA